MGGSLVFVSHATSDRRYVQLLGNYIERTIEDTKAFVASAPDSIPSGSDWFHEILRNLSSADALAIVYSRNARSSLWLGFELGYFWRMQHGKNIHCVFDPTLELPSPLNELQAKDFTDDASMAVFFRGLAKDLGRNYGDDQIGIRKSSTQLLSLTYLQMEITPTEWSMSEREFRASRWQQDCLTSVEDPSIR